jgi:hypothetical protein
MPYVVVFMAWSEDVRSPVPPYVSFSFVYVFVCMCPYVCRYLEACYRISDSMDNTEGNYEMMPLVTTNGNGLLQWINNIKRNSDPDMRALIYHVM